MNKSVEPGVFIFIYFFLWGEVFIWDFTRLLFPSVICLMALQVEQYLKSI